jgi:hypothetical protein
MKKSVLLLFVCGWGWAEQVQITSPLPLPTTITNSTGSPVHVGFGTPANVTLSSSTIDFSASGATTVIPGIALQTIRVFQLFLVNSTATNLTLKDGSTELAGPLTMTANGSIVLDFNGEPWFQTSAGNGFVINQSGTAQISGRIYYQQS